MNSTAFKTGKKILIIACLLSSLAAVFIPDNLPSKADSTPPNKVLSIKEENKEEEDKELSAHHLEFDLSTVFSIVASIGVAVLSLLQWVDSRLDNNDKRIEFAIAEIEMLKNSILNLKDAFAASNIQRQEGFDKIENHLSKIELLVQDIVKFNKKLGFIERDSYK